MCDKAILENSEKFKSVLDCYKNKEMCNKAIDNYPRTLEFVLECYKTQKMCDKTSSCNKICFWMVQESGNFFYNSS